MDVDLATPPPPPPTTVAVGRRSPTPPTSVVVGTIAAHRGQPPHAVDAPRGRIIFTGHHPNRVAPSRDGNSARGHGYPRVSYPMDMVKVA
jgi:hypothetical protein